jgi:hypothetical protein
MDRGEKCGYLWLGAGSLLAFKNAAARRGALMRWSVVVRAWGGAPRRLCNPIGVCSAVLLAGGVAGCSSSPLHGPSALVSPAALGSTVAFESIDGPPPEVFNRLVASLNDEAGARKITVVSRSAPATYRIRGYVSAVIERGKTSFAWVWDVYDADKRRALRISGEESAGPGSRRDAWTAADAQVLHRMARNGIEQIAGFLNAPERPPAAAPEPNLVTLVSKRDDSPEAAGIFRVSGAQDSTPDGQPEASTTAGAVEAPPPPRARAARTRSASVAPATDGRAPHP